MLRQRKENGTSDKTASTGASSSAGEEEGNPRAHRAVYLVFFSLLLDLLAFTIILPLLPTILERYRVNDSSGLYDYLALQIKYFQRLVGAPEKYSSVLFGGFLGSMFSFLQFVISPIMGGLSDCYGRKPILLMSLVHLTFRGPNASYSLRRSFQVGISFSYVLWALSSNFLIFVLARFVGGLSKGNISLSMAIITDVSDTRTRARAMALVGIAFSIGFIVGPMIGAMFSIYSDKTSSSWFWYPAMFAFALSIADVLFIMLFFEESLPKVQTRERSPRFRRTLSNQFSYCRTNVRSGSLTHFSRPSTISASKRFSSNSFAK